MKYTIHIYFFIFILLLPTILLSQSFSISFHPHIPDSSFFYISEINSPFYSDDSGSAILLRDGAVIQQYSLFKKEIQSHNDSSIHNTISILVGTVNQHLIVVVDKNFNHSFMDDSVYYLPLKLPGQSNVDYIKQLPIIYLNNVTYTDTNYTVHSFDAAFRCEPLTASGKPFSDTTLLKQTNCFKVNIISYTYYESELFKYNGNSYQFRIFPYSLTAAIYPKQMREINEYAAILFYAIEKERLQLVAYNVLDYVLQNRQRTVFGKDSMHIQAIDFDSQILHFTIDSALSTHWRIPYSVLVGSNLYQLALHKNVPINFQEKPFTILEFSGSWCKPCMALQPAIEQLQHHLPDTFQFMTILNEYSLENAQLFYWQHHPNWPVYYEAMGNDDENTLHKQLQVGVYPTFMVTDASGNILFNENGMDALEKLCQQFKILFKVPLLEKN
ncbi:MAG: TlpA family protein disulfide reductase [Hydrotalea sp. AMD]|uniref:TlpA family protein disulfide reductase n=1 Tax=Hydrotalea TaxID=1004300 RepID=UPI0009431DA3|nr:MULTISPECIES: TlpA disulfide reductase family protein [Hydrotalea]RWZ90159.1 MAG: TlpA family protein disulfide reductase [Hydrotalea sp. AMD]